MSLTPTPSTGRARSAPAHSGPRLLLFGDVLDDVIVAPEKTPVGNTDTMSRIQHRAGGSAANTAAWLGSEGVQVDFVGRVGVGDLQRHSQLLANAGVTPRLSYATAEHTGTVVIVVAGSERTMLTDRGASANFDLAAIDDSLLEGTSIVHLTGYSIVHGRSPVAFRRLVGRIRAAGALLSIDPASSGFIREYGAETFLDLVEGADLFFPNLDEGRLLTGAEEPEDVVRALMPRFGTVAMPLADGAAVVGRTGEKILRTRPLATRLVDPTGGGDAFGAGFLACWAGSLGRPAGAGAGSGSGPGSGSPPSLALAARRGVKLMAQAFMTVGGRPVR